MNDFFKGVVYSLSLVIAMFMIYWLATIEVRLRNKEEKLPSVLVPVPIQPQTSPYRNYVDPQIYNELYDV